MSTNLEILTAEGEIFNQDVDVVVLPGIEGELAVLPGHAPLVTKLDAGQLMIRIGKQEEYVVVFGGFVQVLAHKVTVLADAAERVDQIDEDRAKNAMDRAQSLIAPVDSDVNLERALSALRRSTIRLNVSARFKKRKSRGSRQESQM